MTPWRHAFIGAIVLEDPGLGVVCEAAHKPFLYYPVLEAFVLDRKAGFDAMEEVSSHPVGAAEVDLFFAAIQEIKIRLCSRKRPTIERTWIFSETPVTPGRKAQTPRTMRSILTPAREAS